MQLWTFLLVLQVMLFTNFFLQISSYPYFLSVFLTLVHSTSSSSYLITFTYVALSFFFTFSDSASSLWKFYLLIILLSHIYPFSSILMLSLLHISRHFIYYCIAYCIIFCIYEFLSFPYSLYFSSVARIYFMFFFNFLYVYMCYFPKSYYHLMHEQVENLVNCKKMRLTSISSI